MESELTGLVVEILVGGGLLGLAGAVLLPRMKSPQLIPIPIPSEDDPKRN